MDKQTARSQWESLSKRQSFPERTNPNPNRPLDNGREIESRTERGDRGYPESCNPNGSKPPLNSDQQALASRYLPLARSMAKRMADNIPKAGDDFHSAAVLALVEAAQHFDPARGVNFATFARHRIGGALLNVRREFIDTKRSRDDAARSYATRMGYEISDDDGRLVLAPPPAPVGSELEALDTLENWLRQLPRLQAQAFRHIYIDGKTQVEAAVLIGCSKWTLNRMHSEGLKLLQEICEQERAEARTKPIS